MFGNSVDVENKTHFTDANLLTPNLVKTKLSFMGPNHCIDCLDVKSKEPGHRECAHSDKVMVHKMIKDTG